MRSITLRRCCKCWHRTAVRQMSSFHNVINNSPTSWTPSKQREQHQHYIRFQQHNSLQYPVKSQASPQRDTDLTHVQRTHPGTQQMIRVWRADELPPNHKNFTCRLFQKLTNYKKRPEVVNNSLLCKFYNHRGNETHKQLVVPEATMANIIMRLRRDPMQGHLGSSKQLHTLRERYYSRNLAEQVQRFFKNCDNSIKAKPCAERNLKPPLQQIYDPCDGPTDIMEYDLVGELPNSNGFTQILTATDVFPCHLFAVPLKKPVSSSVVKTLKQISTQHAYVPRHIITDKGSAFTSQVIKRSWTPRASTLIMPPSSTPRLSAWFNAHTKGSNKYWRST